MRKQLKIKSYSLFFFCVLAIGIVGCGGETTPTREIPPEEIIDLSLIRFEEMTGFEFQVKRSGEPAFIDADYSIAFRRAEGVFIFPDKVDTTVRVIAPGIVAEIQIIVIGDNQWETNMLTGDWQDADLAYGFNPATLFTPGIGIQSILETDLREIEYIGLEELEEIPGLELYALTAVMDGDRVHEVTYGMIDRDTLDVKLWIEPGSYNLHKVVLVDPADDGEEEDTIWEIDFWNFDKEFQIIAPSLGGVHG